MRARLLKLAGLFGDLTGISVAHAKAKLRYLPRSQAAQAATVQRALIRLQDAAREVVWDHIDARRGQRMAGDAKLDKLNDVLQSHGARLEATTGDRMAGVAYRERNYKKILAAQNKFVRQGNREYFVSEAQALRSNPEVVSMKQQYAEAHRKARELSQAEKELQQSIPELEKARDRARRIASITAKTVGVAGAATVGGMALRRIAASRTPKLRRNLVIGGAGAAGLAGLAAYKRKEQKY